MDRKLCRHSAVYPPFVQGYKMLIITVAPHDHKHTHNIFVLKEKRETSAVSCMLTALIYLCHKYEYVQGRE